MPINDDNNSTRNRIIAAIVLVAAAFCLLAVAFFVSIGVYLLIASAGAELAALAVLGKSKEKPFKIVRIIAFCALGVTAAVFAGGLIFTIYVSV